MNWLTMKSAAILLLLMAATVHADEIRGKVVGIADGDTITVLDAEKVQHKIRLEGIDAPEKGQAFGTKSKEKMSELVGEKEVVVKWSKKDRYGRILGDVYLGDRHINVEMVKDGLAWHFKQYSNWPKRRMRHGRRKRGFGETNHQSRLGSFGNGRGRRSRREAGGHSSWEPEARVFFNTRQSVAPHWPVCSFQRAIFSGQGIGRLSI